MARSAGVREFLAEMLTASHRQLIFEPLSKPVYQDFMRLRIGIALVIAALAAPDGAWAQRAAERLQRQRNDGPILVEFYVSQASGASVQSAELAQAAAGRGAIVLTFPVDYWDYRGWADTMAQPEHAARQDGYRKKLPNERLYTPQAVVQGAIDVRADSAERLLEAMEDAPRTLARAGGRLDENYLTIELTDSLSRGPFEVWVAPFKRGAQSVEVKAGENRGRTMSFMNVVHGLRRVGVWNGGAVTIRSPVNQEDYADAWAIIVQRPQEGAVIAIGLVQ